VGWRGERRGEVGYERGNRAVFHMLDINENVTVEHGVDRDGHVHDPVQQQSHT